MFSFIGEGYQLIIEPDWVIVYKFLINISSNVEQFGLVSTEVNVVLLAVFQH